MITAYRTVLTVTEGLWKEEGMYKMDLFFAWTTRTSKYEYIWFWYLTLRKEGTEKEQWLKNVSHPSLEEEGGT